MFNECGVNVGPQQVSKYIGAGGIIIINEQLIDRGLSETRMGVEELIGSCNPVIFGFTEDRALTTRSESESFNTLYEVCSAFKLKTALLRLIGHNVKLFKIRMDNINIDPFGNCLVGNRLLRQLFAFLGLNPGKCFYVNDWEVELSNSELANNDKITVEYNTCKEA